MAGVGLELPLTQKPGPGPGPRAPRGALGPDAGREARLLCVAPVRGPELGPRPRVAQQDSAEGCGLASAGFSPPRPSLRGEGAAGALGIRRRGRGRSRSTFSIRNNCVLISQTNLASPSLCTVMAALPAVLASSHWIVSAGAVESTPGGPIPWAPRAPGPVPHAPRPVGPRHLRRTRLNAGACHTGPQPCRRPVHRLTCRSLGARPICAATSRTLGPGLDPLRSAPARLHPLAPRRPPPSGQAARAFAQPGQWECVGEGGEVCGGQRRK